MTNEKTLVEQKDYLVDIQPNDITSFGRKIISIRGIKNYYGEIISSYFIYPDIKQCTIELEQEEFEYRGEFIKPRVYVILGTIEVNDSELYQCFYTNDISNCSGQVLVSSQFGEDNYQTKDFKIVNQISNCVANFDEYVFSNRDISAEPNFNYYGQSVGERTGYQLKYPKDVKSAGEKALSAYGNGMFIGCKVANYTIRQRDLSDVQISCGSEYKYTGKPVCPDISCYFDDTRMTKDKDYVVEYINNVKVGMASADISGIGNFCGNEVVEYAIVRRK